MALLSAIVRPLAAALNIVANGVLLAATALSKFIHFYVDLRSGPCGLLIALDAAFNALSAGAVLFVETLVFPLIFHSDSDSSGGEPVVEVDTCFLMLFLPVFVAVEMTVLMPLAIAVERLLSVLFPFWRMVCNETVMGAMSTLSRYFSYKNFGVVALCWGCYAAIWLRLRLLQRRKQQHNHQQIKTAAVIVGGPHNNQQPKNPVSGVPHQSTPINNSPEQELYRRASRSLLVVVVLVTLGVLIPPVNALLLSFVLRVSPEIQLEVSDVVSLPCAMLIQALTTPSLYLFSTEYQSAIRRLFTRVFCRHRINPSSAFQQQQHH